MRITESTLRRLIKQQLREQAAGYGTTGGEKGQLEDGDADVIFKAINDALTEGLPGIAGFDQSKDWSMRIVVGKTKTWIKNASDTIKELDQDALLKVINDAVKEGQRKKIRGKIWFFTPDRALQATVSGKGVQSPAVEVQDKSSLKPAKPSKCYRTLTCYPRGDECVKKQQLAMGLKDDGLWGKDTEKAWVALGVGPRPADAKDLPACKGSAQPPPPVPATGACQKASTWAWGNLVKLGERNPLAAPTTYAKLSKANVLAQFSQSPDVAKVARSVRLTQDLIEELVRCNGTGPDRGHSVAANQLIAQLEMNVDVFNNSLRTVIDRALKSGEANLRSAAEQLWGIVGWDQVFGALPKVDALPVGLIKLTNLTAPEAKLIKNIGNHMDRADV